MQENKFENRVQQEMDEFRIRPSGSVWEKVEEELRKKKKRRVVFYLFLLTGLGLIGYSGLLIHNYSNSNIIQHAATGTQQVKKEAVEDNVASATLENGNGDSRKVTREEQSMPTDKNLSIQKVADENTKKKTISKPYDVSKQGRSSNKKINNKIPSTKSINKDNDAIIEESVQINDHLLNKNQDSENKPESKFPVSDSGFAGINSDKNKMSTRLDDTVQNTGDSISKDYAKINEDIPAAKIKVKQVAKINWALELSAGMSAYRDKVFSINDGQKSMDRLFSSPGNSGGAQAIFYTPSSIKPGFAFRAGITAEMNVSKRSSISSGVRYAYNSNKIRVGTYSYSQNAVSSSSFSFASSVNNFYRGVQQKQYTNQFHFIQVPFQYQLQLNKGVKVPIIWKAGITPAYLFATNGLVYDTVANGIYFQTNKAFNKVQLDLHTGFSFVFGHKNKIKWSVGPEVSLGLNKLTKTEYTKRQYLLYSGIAGKIIFPKKKK